MHEIKPNEEYEYDTIQIISKVKFSLDCYKECTSTKGNVMFDKIANVPRHDPRTLADLSTESRNRRNTVRFKIDTGAGGNMLSYDTWKEFFPDQSNAELTKTIDKAVTL